MRIFDVCAIYTNTESYEGINSHQIMLYHEQSKKDKYIDPYLEIWCPFMPIIFSVGGVMREETKATTKKLVAALSKKWDRSYLVTSYIQSHLSLVLVQTFSLVVIGTRIGKTWQVRKNTLYREVEEVL